MSSPAFNQWQTPQPQGPPANANNEADEDGVSTRPMRLKVLYTFDDQNKTNCLARGNDVLQIKTVAMDETATIGIIELKTCIELVVQSSPELIARLGQDYTIYAYDYSEFDTPLVGQGMLSRALASPSLDPDAPAQQSQKLITGRVCKNILGIFNNGVKETLEVKLRLVSVPTTMQGEYNTHMEKYREMTRAAGFDPNEWAALLQSNPGLGQMTGKVSGPTNTASSRSGSINMEVVNQLLSPTLSQPQIDSFSQANADNSGNEGRGGTSNGGKAKNTSRPSSRASIKRPRKPRQTKAAVGGNTSGYEEGTDGDDGPAPKKRAKITKTDWNRKSSFGPASDSLRVTASTAGSLRMFRPIAMAVDPPGHLQELPRAPTPVPDLPQNLARNRARSQSTLRRDSTVSQSQLSAFPVLEPGDELRYSIESAGPSPERQSLADTPPEMGSSPPVMRTVSPMRSSPPCPSSPILPQMRRNEADSGFMSGTLDDLFGEDDETMRPIDDEDIETASKYSRRNMPPAEEVHHGFEIQQENPGPVELLPTRMPVLQPPTRPKPVPKPEKPRARSVMSDDGQQSLPPLKNGSRPSSRRPTPTLLTADVQMTTIQNKPQISADAQICEPIGSHATFPQNNPRQPMTQDRLGLPSAPSTDSQSRPASRNLVRTASMGSLTLPTIPQSDSALPPSNLQRSQTWSEAPYPATEALIPHMPGPMVMPMYPPQSPAVIAAELSRAQALEAKKAAMKQKLEHAIANGEMPPFCDNCGAIETPTWRKAWSQDVQGPPPYYEYSDEPGRVTMIVILSRDEQGRPTSYQLIKKFLLPEENQEDFSEVLLCNPCGIWMSKYKSHRPEERWECNRNKKPPEKKKTAQRPAKPRKAKNASNMLTSEANYPQSEAYYPQSEAYNQQSEAVSTAKDGSQAQQTERQRSTSARPVKRLKAMTSDAAPAALRRAIQSSPARWAGMACSPIDVEEEDLGSTRRLLFPSPRKDGSPKVLGELATNVVTIATDFRSPKEVVDVPNKENCPPPLDKDDCDAELLRLFEEEIARPTTPVGKSPSSNPFKTPTRPTPSHRPITRSVTRSIRSATSPGQLLVFQKTPSKTPNSSGRRRSPRNHNFESPFTATLNQIMSDANEHHSPSRVMGLDFTNLPDLPGIDGTTHQAEMNCSLEDFFSTDIPMPSSPPKMNFHLYEDPLTISNIDWNEFSDFDTPMLDGAGKEVQIKKEPGTGDESEESTQPTESSGEQPSS